MTSGYLGSCAILTGGKVDCWGWGQFGQLGNGKFYSTGHDGSAVSVAVKGVGGFGTLDGVASLAIDQADNACALLTSGHVACWGEGADGQLGSGSFDSSAVPVAVKGVGGSGTLTGVANLVADSFGFCARLISGHVECWGEGDSGQLGNGRFYTENNPGSDVPVAVRGGSGTGTLDGVTSLASDSVGSCARLTSGEVACWGSGYSGQLGNGEFYLHGNGGVAIPVLVKGVGGTGTLRGVAGLISDDGGFNAAFCALLTSGEVDCWGEGYYGQLGNGTFYTGADPGSAIPVVVEGVGGTGTLGDVSGLSGYGLGNLGGFCALLTSGHVDCWGEGILGQLGDGKSYGPPPYGSAVPVAVEGVGGSGTLSGVASVTSDGNGGSCAVLTSGEVDCWGEGGFGQLGDGALGLSAFPVAVKGLAGSGTLTGVATVTNEDGGGLGGFCALLTSGHVGCWGYGANGELGNGRFSRSAVPVAVLT